MPETDVKQSYEDDPTALKRIIAGLDKEVEALKAEVKAANDRTVEVGTKLSKSLMDLASAQERAKETDRQLRLSDEALVVIEGCTAPHDHQRHWQRQQTARLRLKGRTLMQETEVGAAP